MAEVKLPPIEADVEKLAAGKSWADYMCVGYSVSNTLWLHDGSKWRSWRGAPDEVMRAVHRAWATKTFQVFFHWDKDDKIINVQIGKQ